MTDLLAITTATSLSPADVAEVEELVRVAATADGSTALNEAGLLHLRHGRGSVVHVLARRGAALLGYAQLEQEAGADTATGQLVVAPSARREGVGSALLSELVAITPAPLRLWAMGHTAAARALAARAHLVPARELLIMTRDLVEPLPPLQVPAGTRIRTFVVGQDEQEWLAVNSRAFRHHPEQGRLTLPDLEDRIAEPWFDPAGFFLAVRPDQPDRSRVVGFHWTKQHPDRLGEVYVLGVDPDAGGGGLGKALLGCGLRYLLERGNTTVQLYVEADSRAVALYTGYGFTIASRDVMYAQP